MMLLNIMIQSNIPVSNIYDWSSKGSSLGPETLSNNSPYSSFDEPDVTYIQNQIYE